MRRLLKVINAEQLIKELQTIDPNSDCTEFLKALSNSTVKTLPFEQAGKAIRALLPILGKPKFNYNKTQGGRKLNCRSCIWSVERQTDKAIAASIMLKAVGITDFRITDANWFCIHIPYEAYVTSFYHSDDPIDWAIRNEKTASLSFKRKQKRELSLLEEQRDYQRAWEAGAAQRDFERTVALEAMKAKAKQELIEEMTNEAAQQIKADDLVVPNEIRSFSKLK